MSRTEALNVEEKAPASRNDAGHSGRPADVADSTPEAGSDRLRNPDFKPSELLAEFKQIVGGQQKVGSDSLELTDIFRDVEARSLRAAKKGSKPDSIQRKEGADSNLSRKEVPEEGARIIGRSAIFDERRPTVAVLDSFGHDERQVLQGFDTRVSHGDFSAITAEQSGFNVVKLQASEKSPFLGDALKDIESKIEKGSLKLGKGDVLNVSMGDTEMSFELASQLLGSPVTKENLAQNKEKLLAKFKEMAETGSDSVKAVASKIIESNEAISRLQDRGITVVHAAGNNGSDNFTPTFLNAKIQLSSNKPNGDLDSFSAGHNLTQAGNGVFGIKSSFDLTDHKSIGRQRGRLDLVGTDLHIPLTGFYDAAIGAETKLFDRNNVRYDEKGAVAQPADPLPLPTALLSGNLENSSKLTKGPLTMPQFNLQGPDLKPGVGFSKTFRTKVANEQINISDQKPVDDGIRVHGILAGTSYSNISWLIQNREALIKGKGFN